MDMNAIPEQAEFTEGELVFLFNLREMVYNGDIVAVLRPDGQIGWMPAPHEDTHDVQICRVCGGSGFLSKEQASLVTADFRLTNLCPECHGTGIEDGQPFESEGGAL